MGSWTILEMQGWPIIHLAATGTGISGLAFTENTVEFLLEQTQRTEEPEWTRDGNRLLADAAAEVREYLERRRRSFDLGLDLRGTTFQRKVWSALLEIPYGETRTYADIARAIGSPGSVRAVGAANGANPVAIVVPCHRVIQAGGGLGGYSGGIELKRRLLDLEGAPVQHLLHSA